jgi:drug/metabolite transporter (DMT)-like permease
MTPAGVKHWYAAVPDVSKGAALMVVSSFAFVTMNVLVRAASEYIPAFEIAVFRNIFAVCFMLPWLIRIGPGAFRTKRFGLHLARAAVGVTTLCLWFSALALVPLAEAVALNFTLPLFGIAGAVWILGEKVGPRRWLATVIGFMGVLVILRPGFAQVSPAMLLPIGAAVFMGLSSVLLKTLSSTESVGTNVLYMNVLMVPLSLIPAAFVWQWPPLEAFVILIPLGACAVLAHISLARAYALADASAMLPFDYFRLPFIAIYGFLIYGEIPLIWTWIGAAIIAGSTIYIARREAQLAKQHKAETVVAETPKGR